MKLQFPAGIKYLRFGPLQLTQLLGYIDQGVLEVIRWKLVGYRALMHCVQAYMENHPR